MSDMTDTVYAILLAGGTGTRLWPVSREPYPKQLVKFIGDDSLVQSTIKRLAPVLDLERVRIVCGARHLHETSRHLENIGLQPEGKIICEPSGRNTAPAILLAVVHMLAREKDAILCVFPADHVVGDLERFHERLRAAIRLADQGYLVTFGITPHYAETGYGYVQGGQTVSDGALTIQRFVEKPDKATAQKYLEAGNFFWNSGMFAFRASVIMDEFRTFQPAILNQMMALFSDVDPIAKEAYEQLPDISIDYAIMERTRKGVVLPSDFGWSDIGSWKSLYDFLPKDADQNVIDGDVIARNTQSCFVLGWDRLIATNHLQNMVVVETPDSIFVSDIDHSRDVKSIVTRLKADGRKEYHQHRTVHLPWGSRTLLEQRDDFSVSRAIVYPAAVIQAELAAADRLHLVVLKGEACVRSGLHKYCLHVGESTTVSGDAGLSIENSGDQPLYLLQVQIGGKGDA